MKLTRHLLSLSAVTVLVTWIAGNCMADVLLQSDSRTRFGDKPFSYFFFEAEDFETNDPHGDGESWLLSSEEDSLLVTVSEEIDPETDEPFEADPGAFASGGESITNALFQSTVTNTEGGGHDVQYLLQFDTPGDYYLYIRHHSPLGPEFDRNKNDSFYTPLEFGEDPEQVKVNGDDYGFLESIEFPGDVMQRGPWLWFAARDDVYSAEADPPIDQDPDTFLEFRVTEAMLNDPLVLEFDHREDGTMLDAFLFVESDSGLLPTNGEGPDGDGFFGIGDAVDAEFGLSNLGSDVPQGIPGDFNGDMMLTGEDIDLLSAEVLAGTNKPEFDLNNDSSVDDTDRGMWIRDIKNTYIGDANLDGEFSSSDLVTVFQGGKFEQDIDASWAEGDWTGDGRFGSSDFVAAFQDGGFELGPRPSQAVPEPTSWVLVLGAAGILIARLRTASCHR